MRDMVEYWRTEDLECKLEYIDALSFSSTSGVLLYRDVVSQKEVVLKSYSIARLKNAKAEKIHPRVNLAVLSGPSYSKTDISYFHKEAALLEALADTRIVPPIRAVIPDYLSIVMDRVDGVQFSKKLLEIERDETITSKDKEVKKNALRERLLEHLVDFYDQTENLSNRTVNGLFNYVKNDAQLTRYSINSFPYLALRTFEEENTRLRHYLFKLVYGGSEEFKNNHPQFYGVGNIPREPSKRKVLWIQAKKEVKDYLMTKGINFNEFSNNFQRLYDDIVFSVNDNSGKLKKLSLSEKLHSGKLRMIHGDFGPHNVLYVSGKLGFIVDFNECRIANPHVDVSLALFNLYSNPPESRVPRLIENFWNTQNQVNQAYPSFPDFLAGCVATRVLQSLRIASCNMDYDSADVERFVEDHPTFKDLPTKDRDVRFKYDRIIELNETIPFYTIGDGNKLLGSANTQRRERLNEFLEMVRNLITVAYIMPPLERYRGKKIQS